MKGETAKEGKKAYRAPRLVVYGDLRHITRGEKGRTKVDNDSDAVGSTKR